MNRVGAILLDFYRYIMYNMVMLVEDINCQIKISI